MVVLTLAGLAMSGGTALASSPAALSPFAGEVLPVLVQVDKGGHVESAVPATELVPELKRLMLRNLDEMITGPAVRQGRPVASQFVANLALKTTAPEEGRVGAHFTVVSVSPVPEGRWHWVDKDGQQLALGEQKPDFGFSSRVVHPGWRDSKPAWNPSRSSTSSVRSSAVAGSAGKRGGG
jgi:hypothetical protein